MTSVATRLTLLPTRPSGTAATLEGGSCNAALTQDPWEFPAPLSAGYGPGASQDDAAPAGSPAQRAKILAAADYLDVAPTVVGVVRDLDLAPVDDRIAVDDARAEAATALAARWNLGTSMTRALAALRG